MATSKTQPLPSYEVPPVIEVVCGVQFEPLDAFQPTAFGLLWERFRDQYPNCEQQPPLAPVVERYDDIQDTIERPQIEFSPLPTLPRVFFVHQDPCWLAQIQHDRFLHNWRKRQESDTYPRFPEVFNRFWSSWGLFQETCRDEKLGTPQVKQLEVTYINHIVQGEGWDGMSNIGEVFPDFSWRARRSFLPAPESGGWRTSFQMPDRQGRLHVSVRHAIRKGDLRPVLLCELTARGVPASTVDQSLKDWFQLGREWIVRGFADLTHERVQTNVWKRKSQ